MSKLTIRLLAVFRNSHFSSFTVIIIIALILYRALLMFLHNDTRLFSQSIHSCWCQPNCCCCCWWWWYGIDNCLYLLCITFVVSSFVQINIATCLTFVPRDDHYYYYYYGWAIGVQWKERCAGSIRYSSPRIRHLYTIGPERKKCMCVLKKWNRQYYGGAGSYSDM